MPFADDKIVASGIATDSGAATNTKAVGTSEPSKSHPSSQAKRTRFGWENALKVWTPELQAAHKEKLSTIVYPDLLPPMDKLPPDYFERQHMPASPAIDASNTPEGRSAWAKYYQLMGKRRNDERKSLRMLGVQNRTGITPKMEEAEAHHFLKKTSTICAKCSIRYTCPRAYEDSIAHNWHPKWSRCIFELKQDMATKNSLIRNYAAFVSTNPEDMLIKLQNVVAKIEAEIDKEPSYAKTVGLAYLLMNVYKMKFGEKMFVARVTKNLDSPTMDIKGMMEELRKSGVNTGAVQEGNFSILHKEQPLADTALPMDGNTTVADYEILPNEKPPYDVDDAPTSTQPDEHTTGDSETSADDGEILHDDGSKPEAGRVAKRGRGGVL